MDLKTPTDAEHKQFYFPTRDEDPWDVIREVLFLLDCYDPGEPRWLFEFVGTHDELRPDVEQDGLLRKRRVGDSLQGRIAHLVSDAEDVIQAAGLADESCTSSYGALTEVHGLLLELMPLQTALKRFKSRDAENAAAVLRILAGNSDEAHPSHALYDLLYKAHAHGRQLGRQEGRGEGWEEAGKLLLEDAGAAFADERDVDAKSLRRTARHLLERKPQPQPMDGFKAVWDEHCKPHMVEPSDG